jgi:shikimate dehydrogenase
MRIGGRTAVAGLIGRPVAHSLSPLIQNAWLEAAGVDGVYVPLEVADAGAVAALVRGLRGGGSVRGVNVTAPFKEAALAAADRAEPAAAAAGAANLLLFEADGTVLARNTDGVGLLHALKVQSEINLRNATVLLIGAGGAARGAAATLLNAGAAEVRIVGRTRARAEALADGLGAGALHVSAEQATAEAGRVTLVVNATPPGAETLPALLNGLGPSAVVMDMNYRPLRTPWLEAAEGRGLRTVDGLEMLIGQAVPSFQAFFGRPPPELDVRGLALRALEKE